MTQTSLNKETEKTERRYDGNVLLKENDAMNHNYVVAVPEAYASGIRGFFQRLFRKWTGFLLKGITEQQTRFNADTVRTMNQVTQYIWDTEEQTRRAQAAFEGYCRETDERIAQLRTDLETRQRKERVHDIQIYDSTDVRMERMMTKILLLEQEVRELKEQLKEQESGK